MSPAPASGCSWSRVPAPSTPRHRNRPQHIRRCPIRRRANAWKMGMSWNRCSRMACPSTTTASTRPAASDARCGIIFGAIAACPKCRSVKPFWGQLDRPAREHAGSNTCGSGLTICISRRRCLYLIRRARSQDELAGANLIGSRAPVIGVSKPCPGRTVYLVGRLVKASEERSVIANTWHPWCFLLPEEIALRVVCLWVRAGPKQITRVNPQLDEPVVTTAGVQPEMLL